MNIPILYMDAEALNTIVMLSNNMTLLESILQRFGQEMSEKEREAMEMAIQYNANARAQVIQHSGLNLPQQPQELQDQTRQQPEGSPQPDTRKPVVKQPQKPLQKSTKQQEEEYP